MVSLVKISDKTQSKMRAQYVNQENAIKVLSRTDEKQ